MVIKKVFEGVFDEEVHSDFLKFSRGEFKDKYMIEAKKQKDRWSIKTSAEFVNFLVKRCLEKVKTDKVEVTGIIVTTLNLGTDEELGFEVKKRGNFQGIRKLQLETSVNPKTIINLMDKYPRVFFALTFKSDNFELKVKAKAPKSGKPGKNNDEEGPKVDFCSLKTNDLSLVKVLLFDVDLNKAVEVTANHILKINEIVYPKDVKTMKPEEVREKSKRKGIVVRNLTIDGVKKCSEAEFVA